MGFIKAFSGALGGAFADQWKDLNLEDNQVLNKQRSM